MIKSFQNSLGFVVGLKNNKLQGFSHLNIVLWAGPIHLVFITQVKYNQTAFFTVCSVFISIWLAIFHSFRSVPSDEQSVINYPRFFLLSDTNGAFH
jgi:hypothetical protein